jgi:hypothetical protein
MFNPELTAAVEKFASMMIEASDSRLDQPWHWKGHDEGIRFAFFVTHLELRQLAVRLSSDRAAGLKMPYPSLSQRILAQYHSAFMDLQAALIGISLKNSVRAPAKKEWSVQATYSHILEAELGFASVIRYALENHRSKKWLPNPIPEKDFFRYTGLKEKAFAQLMDSSLPKLIAFHREFHTKLLSEFSGIGNDELGFPAAYWEETRFHIGYRLHRFEAHLRQHTIQIDRTLAAIDCSPTESKRLIRMLFSALAEVNGNLISTTERKSQECIEMARNIDIRVKEISRLIK